MSDTFKSKNELRKQIKELQEQLEQKDKDKVILVNTYNELFENYQKLQEQFDEANRELKKINKAINEHNETFVGTMYEVVEVEDNVMDNSNEL